MVMPEGGGEEPRVNVIIGGMLDEASFQAEIQRAKELIQSLAQQLGTSFREAAKTSVGGVSLFQGFDPKAVEEALKQLGVSATKSFELAGQAAQDYRMRVNALRNDIVNLAAQQKISLEDAAKGLQMAGSKEDKALIPAALNEELALRRKITQEIAANSNQVAALEKNNAKEVAAEQKKGIQEREAGIKQTAILEQNEEKATAAAKKIAVQEAMANSKQLAMLEQADARATAAAKKAAYQSDIAQIKLVKQEIINLSKQGKMSLQDAAGFMPSEGFSPAVISAGMHELSQRMDITKQSTGGLQSAFTGLGLAGKYIFGTIMGIGVAQVLRQFIQLMQEATAAALEFTKSVFQLEVGVRALQRQGLDITLAGVYEQINKLAGQFPQFSTAQLTEGFAQAIFFARELGLTTKDLDKFTESSLILAQVTGKDVNEVMRTFALTVSSGYSEGLQKMGININRVVIAQKGLEMGFTGGYNAMTQQQRALAAIATVYEQTAKVAADAAKYQETLAGKQAIANANWEQFKVLWGNGILPLTVPILLFFSKGILAAGQLAGIIRYVLAKALTELGYIFAGTAIIAKYAWDAIFGKGFDAKGFMTSMRNVHAIIEDEAMRLAGLKQGVFGDVPESEKGSQPLIMDAEKLIEAEQNLQTDLSDLLESGEQERLDAEEKYGQDLEEIQRDYDRDIEDEAINHQRKLDEITIDYDRKRGDAEIDYARKQSGDKNDLNKKIEDLDKKHRQDELEAERKYQENLRKLQEDFLLNLEETVREGDVKASAKLIRTYRKDKTQMGREYGIDVLGRDEQYNIDLAKLKRDAEDRRQEQAREFAQKMADIARQEAFARADEERRHKQELADLKIRADQKRADRLRQYHQELADLQKNFDDRLKKIADALVKENNLTMAGANQIYQNLLKYYGPNGAILKLYQYLVQAINNSAKAVAETPFLGTAGASVGTAKAAAGGRFIATQPLNLLVGEAGPEIVDVTPLSGKGGADVGRLLASSAPISGGGGYNSGKMAIRIGLEPGLVGEIIDKSVGQMVDVMIRSER